MRLIAWLATFYASASAAAALSGLGGLPKSSGQLASNLDANTYKITGLGAGSGTGDSVEYSQYTTAIGGKADTGDLAAKLDASGGVYSNGTLGTNLDADGYKVTGLAAGSAAGDSVEYSQFVAAFNGLDPKADVYVAVATNVTISAPGGTLDGVTFNSPADLDKRVALVGQTAGETNGIYLWKGAATPMVRAADADTSAEVTTGMAFFVSSGTKAGTQYYLSTSGDITLDTTVLVFSQLTSVSLSSSNAVALGTASAGASGSAARADHVHPTTNLALLAGATFTGQVKHAGSAITKAGVASSGATAATTDYEKVSAHAGNVARALPAATGSGRVLIYKRVDASNADVYAFTITPDGSDTIEGDDGVDANSALTVPNRGARKLVDDAAGKWYQIL